MSSAYTSQQVGGGRSRTSLSSDGRSSRTSGGSGHSESNYMNVVSDGLFQDDFQDQNMNTINSTTDDIRVGVNSKQKNLSSMLYTGSTQSLPNGLPPGSIAKYNMANRSQSTENFVVEHLASFPQDVEDGYLTPAQALIKLKDISSHGGLWAQKMNMSVSRDILMMANAETNELIEEYQMRQINLCLAVLDDTLFENLLIFSTKMSEDKVGAIHLFQCRSSEAGVISEVVNKQRERKAMETQPPAVVNVVNNGNVVHIEPANPNSVPAEEPHETRTEWNLHQRHAVARAVEAFQNKKDEVPLSNNNIVTNGVSPLQDARITRDVEILNKCIEEIENFVVMLKRINEARKQLQIRKSKGSRKKKVENILILQSQPPPDHRIFDIYQKFKHALNLLSKLQVHISEPNAPELIHYLFIPLGIIVKVTGIEKARTVVEPLLTITAVELLGNCLDSREYQFWQSLGPNWTLTKDAEPFKDRYFQVYTPVFIDGWVPPEIVTPQQEAAAQSVARMQDRQRANSTEMANTSSTVIEAALKFKKFLQPKFPEEDLHRLTRSSSSDGALKSRTTEVDGTAAPRNNSFSTKPKVKYGIVIYDYMAHNNKELTIHAGEKVQVLDDSRRWWLVKNIHGEQGYVPSTVLEIPVDSPSVSPNPEPKPEIPAYSPRQTNGYEGQFSYEGTGYDTNQNYVNDTQKQQQQEQQQRYTPTQYAVSTSPIPQPVRTTTPVVISVQLPETFRRDSPVVISQNVQTINTEVQTNIVRTLPPAREIPQKPESPPYAVAKKQTISKKISVAGENANAVITTDYQIQKSTAIIKTQASPPTVQPELDNMPPPPPPPPPAVPPPPPQTPPVLTKTTLEKRTSSGSGGGIKRDDSANDLQFELKNRLSMHAGINDENVTIQRTQTNRVESSPGAQQAMPDVDAVDVFIPLYKSSTADDVSRWLGKLGFSENTIDSLRGKTALELFKTNKEAMIELIGPTEGKQLYDELQVQNGANTRNKGMTELQKALVKRVQKREGQQEARKQNGSPTVSPQANADPSAIRKQKDELERLKKENPVNRTPEAATFTSFASPAAKTQL